MVNNAVKQGAQYLAVSMVERKHGLEKAEWMTNVADVVKVKLRAGKVDEAAYILQEVGKALMASVAPIVP